MQKVNSKLLLLLLGLILPVVCSTVSASCFLDGLHPIQINNIQVQGTPKGNTIQASIDGHYLSVTFTQDIGTLTCNF